MVETPGAVGLPAFGPGFVSWLRIGQAKGAKNGLTAPAKKPLTMSACWARAGVMKPGVSSKTAEAKKQVAVFGDTLLRSIPRGTKLFWPWF